MRFIFKDGAHVVIYITGPRHYYLGLVFGDSSSRSEPEAVTRSNGGPVRLDHDKVVAEVMAGVADAEVDLRRDVYIVGIHYYVDDTPPESEYRRLARRLVVHVFDGR